MSKGIASAEEQGDPDTGATTLFSASPATNQQYNIALNITTHLTI